MRRCITRYAWVFWDREYMRKISNYLDGQFGVRMTLSEWYRGRECLRHCAGAQVVICIGFCIESTFPTIDDTCT